MGVTPEQHLTRTDGAEPDWAALETDINAEGEFAPPIKQASSQDAKTQRFPCTQCGGSGSWRGRGKCYACNGKGYFLTSERDRQKARVQRRESKAKQLADTRAAFDAQYPGIGEYLATVTWSPFLTGLHDKLNQYGYLSERQVAAVRSTREKCAERARARQAEQAAGAAMVDLSPIRAMFETARARGYKRPIYRAAGLEISRAPDHGRNPGALYVKTENNEYLGKIIGTEYTGKPAPALTAIAADPRGEAVRYGQQTGTCSCCGATLTNHNSIEAGIGPVCASKWGL